MASSTDLVASRSNMLGKHEQTLRAFLKKYGTILAFAILIIFNMLATPNFNGINTVWNIIIQVFPIMMTSLAMTLVISSGGIDISVGSTMAIAAVVGVKLLPMGMLPAILIALFVAIVIGMFNGVIITYFKIQPIIVTLIFFISGRGIAQLLNNGYTLTFYNNSFSKIGVYRIGGIIPIQLVMIIVAVGIVFIVVKRASFGYYVQAVGENFKAARFSGINTILIIVSVYAISAFAAGIGGLMEASRACSADPNAIGKLNELDAIAAVVVGGTSMNGGKARVLGTVFGALIIQLITVSVNMNNIPFAFSQVFKAVVIIMAVYLQKV